MNLPINEPHWSLILLFGAILSALLSSLHLLPGIYFKFRRPADYLDGNWNAFHQTFQKDELVIIKASWKIHRNFFNKTIIKVEQDFPFKKYEGELIEYEGNHALINIRGVNFKEIVTVRLINKGKDPVYGLWFGPNNNETGKISTDAWFLTQKEDFEIDVPCILNDIREKNLELYLKSIG